LLRGMINVASGFLFVFSLIMSVVLPVCAVFYLTNESYVAAFSYLVFGIVFYCIVRGAARDSIL
jgi:hypothetical protein